MLTLHGSFDIDCPPKIRELTDLILVFSEF
jgi:hypothetical protein